MVRPHSSSPQITGSNEPVEYTYILDNWKLCIHIHGVEFSVYYSNTVLTLIIIIRTIKK